MKKRNLKVLLVALYHGENMSVRLLQPLVKAQGHQCDILFFKNMKKQPLKDSLINQAFNAHYTHELPTEADYDKLREFLALKQPDIIGINVLSITYNIAVRLSAIIREVSDAIIVWGGPHCTVATEQCTRHCHYICIGEGERTLLSLVKY